MQVTLWTYQYNSQRVSGDPDGGRRADKEKQSNNLKLENPVSDFHNSETVETKNTCYSLKQRSNIGIRAIIVLITKVASNKEPAEMAHQQFVKRLWLITLGRQHDITLRYYFTYILSELMTNQRDKVVNCI